MIDPKRELARRAAMGRLRNQVHVSKRSFSGGRVETRVIVANVYYDVSETELSWLQKGHSAEELGVEPSLDQED